MNSCVPHESTVASFNLKYSNKLGSPIARQTTAYESTAQNLPFDWPHMRIVLINTLN